MAYEPSQKLEKMADFFTARIEDYESHMLRNGNHYYVNLAALVPAGTKRLLDLGCGTGLELDEIFKRLPAVAVTGIDLTPAMLDKLRQKHPDKNLDLICADYFTIDFGTAAYDAALSTATLHHFLRDAKVKLYHNVHAALKDCGLYIESDYMVPAKQRDEMFAEALRRRREENVPDSEFYHCDIPYTIEDQVDMLREAGFTSVDIHTPTETGATLVAHK